MGFVQLRAWAEGESIRGTASYPRRDATIKHHLCGPWMRSFFHFLFPLRSLFFWAPFFHASFMLVVCHNIEISICLLWRASFCDFPR